MTQGLSSRVAVCLLTCGREAYTARTLQTFCEFNDARAFDLLHADDASLSCRNVELAQAAGFKTIYVAPERAGQVAAYRALVAAAHARRCRFVLYLENDWEWAAPFPWGLLGAAECVRLYGAQKQRDGSRPAGPFLMGTHRRIDWRPFAGWPGAECALAHYAGPPSVIETRRALQLAQLESFKAMSLATGRNPLRTVRLGENAVWHIGDQTTADYRA